jgi:hypothetical protein
MKFWGDQINKPTPRASPMNSRKTLKIRRKRVYSQSLTEAVEGNDNKAGLCWQLGREKKKQKREETAETAGSSESPKGAPQQASATIHQFALFLDRFSKTLSLGEPSTDDSNDFLST